MRNDASDDEGDARDEPRQRIQMLVTAGGGGGMPTGRPGSVALHPRYVEQKGPRPTQQAEGRAPHSRPTPKKDTKQSRRHEE
jgi:hypothetical protein